MILARKRLFLKLECENEKIYVFHKIILNIFGSLITEKTFMLDERDPPWFNKKGKLPLEAKIKLSKIVGTARKNFEFTKI